MFYRVANLPIEKVCIIKNFLEVNFSDFKRLGPRGHSLLSCFTCMRHSIQNKEGKHNFPTVSRTAACACIMRSFMV